MRKTMFFLLVLLSTLVAFGQDQPQWKVVQHTFLTGNQSIPTTTIFTPTKASLYRLSAYISQDSGDWEIRFFWTDALGGAQTFNLLANQVGNTEIVYLLVPKAGTPIQYEVSGTLGGNFNVAFVGEQLQ